MSVSQGGNEQERTHVNCLYDHCQIAGNIDFDFEHNHLLLLHKERINRDEKMKESSVMSCGASCPLKVHAHVYLPTLV